MQISFKGKRVVVAGGSRESVDCAGLRAVPGPRVDLRARSGRARCDGGRISALGVKVHALPCDLADREAIAAYVAAAGLRSAASISSSTTLPLRRR